MIWLFWFLFLKTTLSNPDIAYTSLRTVRYWARAYRILLLKPMPMRRKKTKKNNITNGAKNKVAPINTPNKIDFNIFNFIVYIEEDERVKILL
jgi:hypothetical protein